MSNTFAFPKDAFNNAGAVRPTTDGKNFFLPAVIFGPDGVTPISSTNPLAVQLAGPTVQNGRVLVDVSGATIQGTFSAVKSDVVDVILQDTATVTGFGTPFTIGPYKTITIEISGTSLSRTIAFEAAGPSGAYYAISGVKLLDLSSAIKTTGTGELWQFDITGLTSFRTNITAVAGGNVSVKGKAVA